MFPQDRYTPHGYLDNPAHAWKAGPGGVLRSRPAIGLGWHYPSWPHGYNYVWHYRAFLQLGFSLGKGPLLLEQDDFERANLKLYSDYHSKNWLSYVFETPEGLHVRAIYYLAEAYRDGGDALGCLVQIRNRSEVSQQGRLVAALDYTRNLGQGLDWANGLYARLNGGGLSVAAFQEGTALHLRADKLLASRWFEGNSLEGLPAWVAQAQAEAERSSSKVAFAPGEEGSAESGPTDPKTVRKVGAVEWDFECEAGGETTLMLTVARDASEWRARRRTERLLADEAGPLYEALSRGKAEDDAFWATAPKLSGDWPEEVRRGLVYDFETLRMMVRRPTGIYKYPWDAMQIQVPRTVLAEAALDMLILSYADPQMAKAVLLGTFADAPEPNVPCSREDGSYNMVAVDGSPCGTAPEWCFPFHCIELVYRRTADQGWLAQLYPYLEAFMEFWQRNRTDALGRSFYKCSWEAGQDNSARFAITDDPSGGGALGEHLWPVDLQAAMAQSCWLLAAWGHELGLPPERVERWNVLGGQHAALMAQMWQPGSNWFHDFDRRSGAFTNVIDTMQLAPLLCRVARPDQIAALQAQLENPPKHGQVFHPLMWPSVVFCLVEACSEAGRPDLAARHGWAALERVYRWLDSNPVSTEADRGGLPGVGREYWPQVGLSLADPPRGGGGAEVYGWGCLGAYLLLRYVVGLQEERPSGPGQVAFALRPNLPAVLLVPGKIYRVGSLPCQNALVDITYEVMHNGSLATQVSLANPARPEASPQLRNFTLANGETVRLNFQL